MINKKTMPQISPSTLKFITLGYIIFADALFSLLELSKIPLIYLRHIYFLAATSLSPGHLA